MASYKGHVAGGFVAAAAYTAAVSLLPVDRLADYAHLLTGWQVLTGVFIIAMLFGLFPDVDTKSKGQGIFYWAAFLLLALLIWAQEFQVAAYFGLVCTLPLLSKHRGWTHSIMAAFLVPAPIIVMPYIYSDKLLPVAVLFYGAAVVGYLSHILLDGELLDRLKKLL